MWNVGFSADGEDQATALWRPEPGTRAAEVLALVEERRVVRWADCRHIVNGRTALELLLASGLIEKVRHGVYRLRGANEDVDQCLRGRKALGRRQRQLHELLVSPMLMPELQALMGVSRQAVHQLLQRMMTAGLICRVRSTGEAHWLYVRTDSRVTAEMLEREPRLTALEAQLLCNLPTSGGTSRWLIREVLPSYLPALHRLLAKGLVEAVGRKWHSLIRLTDKGRKHSTYAPDAEHLPVRSEFDAAFKLETRALMLALDALGEANAHDLSAVAGIKPRGKVGTGHYLQRLVTCGYVQQNKRTHSSELPTYQLTSEGRAAITALGERIDPNEALRRLEEARIERSRRTRERLAGRRGHLTRHTVEIITLLSGATPLRPKELAKLLTRPYKDPESLYLALGKLRKRGLADRAPDQPLWYATAAGRDLASRIQ